MNETEGGKIMMKGKYKTRNTFRQPHFPTNHTKTPDTITMNTYSVKNPLTLTDIPVYRVTTYFNLLRTSLLNYHQPRSSYVQITINSFLSLHSSLYDIYLHIIN